MESTVKSTLRHLRAFQMVAQLRNIRRAAEAVHLTQPAVTLAIAKLECQAEAMLFERQSRGTYLTAAGELLSARIDRMFAQIEATLSRIGATEATGTAPAVMAERITRAQIRALCAVARGDLPEEGEGGVSRSSLHRSVREMERSLGVTLVHPAPGGLGVNAAGAELARNLTIALNEIDYGLDEIAVQQRRQNGMLRIGAMPLTGSFVVGPVLNDLAMNFPDARLEVKTGDRNHLSRALQRGEIDLIIGLVHDTGEEENILQERLVALPYVLVARKGHPLSGRGNLTIADLEGFDWVSPNHRTARRETFERLAARMSRPPAANIQASSLSTLRLLISGSDRLALLTRFEYEQERPDGMLTDLAFGPIEPAHWLGISTRANWAPTPLHRKFIDLVRQRADRIAASAPHRRVTETAVTV